MTNVIEPGTCFWCHTHCGGTCLGVNEPDGPRQMKTSDPAYWMLSDGHTSTPQVRDEKCYICRDPEFAAMGLPLCRPCPDCSAKAGEKAGHVPADDIACTVCGSAREYEEYMKSQEEARPAEAG